jgi:hypothetical protein
MKKTKDVTFKEMEKLVHKKWDSSRTTGPNLVDDAAVAAATDDDNNSDDDDDFTTRC